MALSEQEINTLEEKVRHSPAGRNNPFIGMKIDQETVNRLFVCSLVSGRHDMFNYFLQYSIPKADINSLRCKSLTKGDKPCIEDYLRPSDFNVGDPTFKKCRDNTDISDDKRYAGAHNIIQQVVKEHPKMLKTINIPVLAAHFGDKKTLEDVLKTPDKYCDINTPMCTRETNVLKIVVSSGDTQLFKKLLQQPQIKPSDYSIGLNIFITSNKGFKDTTGILSALYKNKHHINSQDLKELINGSLVMTRVGQHDTTQEAKDFGHILSKIIKQNPNLKTEANTFLTNLKEGEMLNDLTEGKKAIIDNIQKAIEAPNRESKVKITLRKIKSAMHSFTKLPSKISKKIRGTSAGQTSTGQTR